MNIVSKRELLRGTIESIKDQVSHTHSLSFYYYIMIKYGFINYKEGGATQSVFFHMNSMSGIKVIIETTPLIICR